MVNFLRVMGVVLMVALVGAGKLEGKKDSSKVSIPRIPDPLGGKQAKSAGEILLHNLYQSFRCHLCKGTGRDQLKVRTGTRVEQRGNFRMSEPIYELRTIGCRKCNGWGLEADVVKVMTPLADAIAGIRRAGEKESGKQVARCVDAFDSYLDTHLAIQRQEALEAGHKSKVAEGEAMEELMEGLGKWCGVRSRGEVAGFIGGSASDIAGVRGWEGGRGAGGGAVGGCGGEGGEGAAGESAGDGVDAGDGVVVRGFQEDGGRRGEEADRGGGGV